MNGAAFVPLRVTAEKGAANGGSVGSRRGRTTERTQEVPVTQQLTFLASENEPKSHGAAKGRMLSRLAQSTIRSAAGKRNTWFTLRLGGISATAPKNGLRFQNASLRQ